MASTSPARASHTARSIARPANCPASVARSASAPSPVPRPHAPTPMRERAGMAASRSSGPRSTRSASRGLAVMAAATTSGPTPRGSPSVTARRGRPGTMLEADVHVGHAAELIEVVLLRQVLAQLVANAVLHVFERVVARGLPLDHDQDGKLGPLARR